ncbi:hypothetical protein COCHEDRAFT_1019783 [Bipolaris maydis C5]|uniref:Uncharacterized protein n=2 Tax=Cochliobolus heterostrophus TaxID=5016 RepID=M2U8C3_COCH5|nr:hypothetical protein COCHEDRAFT_1019783 [Bipolaris maydis C5]
MEHVLRMTSLVPRTAWPLLHCFLDPGSTPPSIHFFYTQKFSQVHVSLGNPFTEWREREEEEEENISGERRSKRP